MMMTSRSRSLSGDEPRDDDGFTLIELLIVIVVLGILAAVVVFALGSVTGDAKRSACNADAKSIVTAVQVYNANDAPVDITTESTSGAGSITPGNPATYYAAGTQGGLLLSSGLITSWPSTNDGYSLSLSTTKAGDVTVYVPSNAAVGQSYDAEATTSVATGCDRL